MAVSLMSAHAAAEQEPIQNRLIGNLGLGVYATQSSVRGRDAAPVVLPYAYIDYGRFFARIDTFGAKTIPMGSGYLELVARINFDGFDTDAAGLRGLATRAHSLPLGVGTLQKTPVGAFFLNAFHDVNHSGGKLFEAIYAAKFTLGHVAFFPLLGAEYRGAKSIRYYYGVSAAEAAASGHPVYRPGGAFNPLAAMHVEIPVTNSAWLSVHWRRKWLDESITDSPIVQKSTVDSAFMALSYEFK